MQQSQHRGRPVGSLCRLTAFRRTRLQGGGNHDSLVLSSRQKVYDNLLGRQLDCLVSYGMVPAERWVLECNRARTLCPCRPVAAQPFR
jgi:hypothetical protein